MSYSCYRSMSCNIAVVTLNVITILLLIVSPMLVVSFKTDEFNYGTSSDSPASFELISLLSKLSHNKNMNVTREYLDEIIHVFGTDGTINFDQFTRMIKELHARTSLNSHSTYKHSDGDESITTNDRITRNDVDSANKTILETGKNTQINKCLNSSSFFLLYNFTVDYNITRDDLLLLSPAILHQLYTCNVVPVGKQKYNKSAEAWGYGFLFVTLINLCALCGVVVLPVMNTRIYKKVLLFLVALAVGSLAGSGLLVLIPEAFELVGTQEDRHGYLWMSTTIMGGVYLFFLIERFLKSVFEWKKNREHEAEYSMIMDKNKNRQISCVEDNPNISDIVCSVKSKTPVDNDTAKLKDPSNYHASASQCTSSLGRTNSSEFLDVQPKAETNYNDNNHLDNNGIIKICKNKPIKTVAWMIIFGDALHNFIDGLSIGAAFTSSVMTGISVSLAVICEELPHELGDFAILLNSGMTLKKALLFNFLSACMCYVGLIFGILLAEVTAAHTWIFGVAGGMFLYISLVDMMPEMNQVVDSNESQEVGKTQLFILQNIGMILGFSVILVISYYAEDINIDS